MTSVVLLGLVTVFTLWQCLIWWRRERHAAAVVGLVYIIVYFFDLIFIGIRRGLTITVTIRDRAVSDHEWNYAVVLALLVWCVYSCAVFMLRGPQTLVPGAARPPGPGHWNGSVFAFVALSALSISSVLEAVLAVGVRETLALRQGVFGESLLALVGYYLAPVLFVFGVILATRIRGVSRFIVLCFALGNLGATILTGSRTGLFLTAVIPLMLYAFRMISISKRSLSRDLKRMSLFLVGALVPFVGGSWYLASTRGVIEDDGNRSVFEGVDISQADVLIGLILNGAASVERTYLGAIASFYPREWWPEKPVSGNTVSSLILAPERYLLTKSEVTAGILGEAYINFGLLAPVGAGLILAAFVWMCQKFLSSPSEPVWILGVVLVMRGLNLVRGDLANIVTPTVLALVAWFFIFGYRRTSRPRRSTSWSHDSI